MHPFVEGQVIKPYGIPNQILEQILIIIDNNPDAKAKEILMSLTLKRKMNQKLKKENELKKDLNPDFVPLKEHNPRFIFPVKLLPSLKQVVYIFNWLYILFSPLLN